MAWSRKEALKYTHEDLPQSLDYDFKLNGRWFKGREIKTQCGYWFSSCEDEPNYRPELWRWNRGDDRPTCPRCVEKNPYGYPGMFIVILGGLGIPQIVRVTTEDTWEGVLGFAKGRIVNAEGKQIVHVCQEGDIFEDIGLVVRDGELVPVQQLQLVEVVE